jgi:hypothetical protein
VQGCVGAAVLRSGRGGGGVVGADPRRSSTKF